ncbi:MAG: insulinase family protein [Armatimonadetes bacterium]|nr:insulinase family protein [Armatimonadota bacterium]
MKVFDPVRTVLPNGCVLIAQRLIGAPLISLYGFVKGGTVWELPEKVGSVNLMAQVLRRGTETKTAQEIDDALERRGAELSFTAGHEGIAVQLSCLPRDFAYCVSLLAEILRYPTFPEEELEKQRLRLINALKDAATRPEEVSYRRFLSLAYSPDHPFHYPSDGTLESVAALSRDDILEAYRKAFNPARTVFAVVGDMEPQEMLDPIAEAISDWETDSPKEVDFPPASLPESLKREHVGLPDKLQAWINMGHKGLKRNDERFYAANVMTTILGAGWGRLFTQIRDNQGLAYAVGASLQAGLGEGPFVVRMGVNPKDIGRAIDSAIAELNKIRTEPPSEDEVSDAKSYLLGRLVLSMETTGGIAAMLVSCELYGLGLDYPQRAKSFYEPITPDQVREVALEVIHPERLVISIAGP